MIIHTGPAFSTIHLKYLAYRNLTKQHPMLPWNKVAAVGFAWVFLGLLVAEVFLYFA